MENVGIIRSPVRASPYRPICLGLEFALGIASTQRSVDRGVGGVGYSAP